MNPLRRCLALCTVVTACSAHPRVAVVSGPIARFDAAVDASDAVAPAVATLGARARGPCRLAVDARPARVGSSEDSPSDSRGISQFEDPSCPEDDPMCDSVDRAPRGAPACFVSNDHIAREERSIAHERLTGAPLAAHPWNRRASPQYWDLVDRHLHFSDGERAALERNGFVALDRLDYDSYALAYHEVFRQQLPVYIGVDSILHAAFVAHSSMLKSVESERLAPALRRMLASMRAALRADHDRWPVETRRDLDLYLSVAAKLLLDERAGEPLFAQNAESVERFVDRANSGELEEVELFGRSRMVDFSQFSPRGHYTESVGPDVAYDEDGSSTLERYFRAVQWLSRVEFNLVSRGSRSSAPVIDRSETPREAIAAVALARLVARSGSSATLAEFERVYSVFGGRREDVSLPALAQRTRAARIGDPRAFSQIKTAIGEDFQRSARVHFTPEGAGPLPAISTMFGPRIVPDVAPLTRVVHDSIPERVSLSAADVGYALGHTDRARALLTADIQRFPTLIQRLDDARDELARSSNGRDLYSLWLRAALTLQSTPTGTWPSFATTDAFRDYRLNSALVTYAQIRHNYVLLAGQGYDAYGCEIPDGYVEPAVETWEALREFTRAAREIDPSRRAFFDGFARVIETLRTISLRERAGLALTAAQKRWIAMVAEYIPRGGYSGDSGQPPKWTGWYFDLFADREISAEKAADFIADYFTLTNVGRVQYLGARTPVLGAFVVDTNGAPRIMVGPIARGYERSEPIAQRLDDEDARSLDGETAAWRATYAVRSPSVDRRDVTLALCSDSETRVVVRAAEGATVEARLLDHHGDPLGSVARARANRSGTTIVAFDSESVARAEDVHVRVTIGAERRDLVLHNAIASSEPQSE